MMMSTERDWTFAQHKNYLTRVDFYQRLSMKKEAIKKSNIFVEQYAKARFEAAHKDRDKYAIISRPDSEEYRRWESVSKVTKLRNQCRVAYQSGLLTLSLAERPDTVRIAYDLNSGSDPNPWSPVVAMCQMGDTISCVRAKSAYDAAKPRTCCFWTIWVHPKSFRKCALIPFFRLPMDSLFSNNIT